MIYLFLADGFEEIEALTPVDYLRRAGIGITTVGVTGSFVHGARNITVKADITIDEAIFSDETKMLILPGGLFGTQNLENNPKVISMIEQANEKGIFLCAICAAPTIFAKMGLLDGKKCVCYPDMQDILTQYGGIVCDEAVVRDGNFITSRAAGSAEQFALSLIEALSTKENAEKVRRSIVAR